MYVRRSVQLITERSQRQQFRRRVAILLSPLLLAAMTLVAITVTSQPASATGSPCGASVNPIVCENQQAGTPESVWDPTGGSGDPTIQGFSTDISVNAGSTISFKIDTVASAYSINIYRLGYYGGDGARHITSVTPSAHLPQVQPSCVSDPTTSLYDCGTWGVSASWPVPSTAVSGVYLADLQRTDVHNGEVSQITFVVRNDASTSDIVYQTSDETWEAYNRYGGSDFYTGVEQNLFDSPTRARELSYNRPFATRGDNEGRDFLFSNEYPTIRFMEENGYDVTYIAGMDTDRYGATLLTHHKVFMSVGHDEYWSQAQLTNVTNARNAGVNLMFLSGNEVYWHTRFAASIDGSNTPYRTLICYKETWDNAATDPSGEATATWRDPRFATAPGGSSPENALTGTMYEANTDDLPITVTKSQAQDRIWRSTGLSSMSGASTALAQHTVGYESDEDVDNGFRPAGEIDMSTTVGATPQELTDFGSTTVPGTTTHHITLYRASSGALVFGAGTIQWAWGLDSDHDGNDTNEQADPRMQQATVNMFADMGAQPSTLISTLVKTTASTDHTAPTSTITSPAAGASIADGTSLTVSGTAVDGGGGVVAGVEVSIDGGATWHPATGTTSWSYTGIVSGDGPVSIESRATDDSVNSEVAHGLSVTVTCPCTLFGSTVPGTTPSADSGATTPALADSGDGAAYELGTVFSSTVNGYVTGVRFYKSAANTGTHTGTLWSSAGVPLATGTFTNETATGWQTLTFASPVAINKNTNYTVSYWDPNGHYAVQNNFFYYSPYVAGPLQAPDNTPTAPSTNGLFALAPGFPTTGFSGANYFVDPVFSDAVSAPPVVATQSPAPAATAVAAPVDPTVTFNKAVTGSSVTFALKDSAGTSVPGAVSYDSSSYTATFTPSAALAPGTQYTATVSATDTSGHTMTAPSTWTFATAFSSAGCPCSIFGDSWKPTADSQNDHQPIEVGVKFSSTTGGTITGIRFYKATGDTGVHTGSVWSSTGTLLASATFSTESASGWQMASFSTPIAVTAGTTYVAGYFSSAGYYVDTDNAFSSSVTSGTLTVPAQGGAYVYGSASAFPASSSSANYGVDVAFMPSMTAPTVLSTTPASGATGVATGVAIQASMSTSLQGNPVVTVTGPGSTAVPGTVSLDSTHQTVTFNPTAALAVNTQYSVAISGAKSQSGATQSGTYTWTFTTGTSSGSGGCGCGLFPDTATPTLADGGDGNSVNVGVQFGAATDGFITGVRFYKSAANTGTHTGALWNSAGVQLASGTFTGETASGWQTLTFATPVAVTAGTVYVASYLAPNGHYAADAGYFSTAVTNGPLTASAGNNGVFVYSSSLAFPNASYQNTNYWVDPLFSTTGPPDTTPPTVTATSPVTGATNVSATAAPTATFSEAVTAASVVFTMKTSSGTAVAGATAYNAATHTATFTPTTALTSGASYTASVSATDTSGNAMTAPSTFSFTVSGGTCPCTLFASNATPATVDSADVTGVTLGVDFVPSTAGYVTGLRFYKASTNTGAHVGTLWSAAGASLATAIFTGETESGWQTVTFSSAVPVTAGTTYVASYYAPNGHYSDDPGYFASSYTNGVLSAPAGANGVFSYGTSATFPSQSYNSTNYWVDPIFSTVAPPPQTDTTPPVISAVTATASGTTASVTWTTNESATSRVDYGTTATALTANATVSGASTSHTVSLSGLAANTRYYYRVTSADAASNTAQSPAASSAAASFAPTVAPVGDATVADFTAGTVSSTYVASNGDGEVVLTPSGGVAEFAGTALPSGLTSTAVVTGGKTTVAGGSALVSGANLTTTGTTGNGYALETLATLGKNQKLGWVTSSNSSVQMSYSVNANNQLVATVYDGSSNNASSIVASNWTATPHTFRIEFTSSAATFWLDGVQQYTHAFSTRYGSTYRPQYTDSVTSDAGLTVDWVRIDPYAATGTFTSRVFDGSATVTWDGLSWDATVPTGTTLVVKVRTGSTATPGTGWSAWTTVPTSGATVGTTARYLQYQLAMTSSGSRFATPSVRSVQAGAHL